MDEANGETVAVLNHNRIMAYMVPADVYEDMLEKLDDIRLTEIIRKRADEKEFRSISMPYKRILALGTQRME